ncbi:podocalyxin [Brachyistius frenatus]|uniref:podocalyxin n=1 Tax=Brachyistius frenatus TaxID=100188 RepID=UPI0037E9441F
MRATLRIMVLLLSLSFLFHSVFSNNVSQTDHPVPKGTNDTSTTVASVLTTIGTTSRIETTTHNSKTEITTTSPVTTLNTIVTTSKPMHSTKPAITTQPNLSQTQATTITNNPASTTTSSGTIAVTSIAATTNSPETTTPTVTTDSHKSSVAHIASTERTSQASTSSKVSEVSAMLQVDPGNVEPTKTTTVPTNNFTTEQVSRTGITITPTTQRDSKKGTQVPKVTNEPTSSWTTMPAGNTGTPSNQTKAGPPAGETIGTKDGTTSPQTTTTMTTTIMTLVQPKKFVYSLLSEQETKEEKNLAEVCKMLMPKWQNGTCTLTWQHHNGKVQFDDVEINAKVKTSLANQYYEEITKKPKDNKTLIAILASCGALLIMIIILAVCASHHRKPYNENQQHLTEELHTVENGYHDNPTLEVMEVQPEMQEKKVALNGEFNDSWIVPIDNLLKEDMPDEEDTHL